MRLARRAILTILAMMAWGAALAAQAHEFWIAPLDVAVPPGGRLEADLRVGQMFEGSPLPFFPDNFLRFEAGPSPGPLVPVRGRMGDRPALSVQADTPGLWLIVHETTPRWLTYDDWARFETFTDRHDLAAAQTQHRARGLPRSGFREMYFRHAKALVAVGDAARGADRRVGLPVEIVAETNPYALAGGGTVVLRMFARGAPRGDAQIEVHVRRAGAVARRLARSDASGRVRLDLPAGAEVMASFTTIEALDGDPAAREAVWLSRWASLSFAVP